MKIASRGLIVLALALSLDAARGAAGPAVTTFEAEGVIADVFNLFPRALKDRKEADQALAGATLEEVAARALVTRDGAYAFLETPENRQFLQDVNPGSAAAVKGRLFVSGSLLQIDSLSKKGDSEVDLARYRDEDGRAATLTGANKRQCGLSVADLTHSCTLGHLHHLEAGDGKVYHCLQSGDGKPAFLGEGTHFKNIEVKARVFPGQFLLVEKGKLVP